MAEIAARSGFRGVRAFNAALKDLYGRPPSALRGRRESGPTTAPPAAATSSRWGHGVTHPIHEGTGRP